MIVDTYPKRNEGRVPLAGKAAAASVTRLRAERPVSATAPA